VTVCASSDAINCSNIGFEMGWIVRTGAQTNDPVNQQLLQDTIPRRYVRINGSGATSPIFTYLPNGLPSSAFAGMTIGVCPTDPSLDALVREMVISRAGRVRLEQPGACPF
jgi:hypothetical protein